MQAVSVLVFAHLEAIVLANAIDVTILRQEKLMLETERHLFNANICQ